MTVAFDYVPAAELDRVPVRMACSPLPTVFTVTRDALQDGRRGTSAALRAAVLARLRRRDAVALAPLTDPRCSGWPNQLSENDAAHETLDEALDRLIATPPSAVLETLEGDPDELTPGTWWDPLRRDPDRWLRSYVDAIYHGWLGLEPLWRRSAALLEREVERVDAASDRGVPTTQIVAEVHTRASLVDDNLGLVPAATPRRLGVGERGVVLAPMIAGGRGGIISTPRGRFVRTAYPLPGAWRAFEDQAPPAASLEALLGSQRSALLRRLERSHVAGELGAALGLSPSATSFQLRALEAAGLIARERRGRNVVVRRTQRGTVLLALYERE